MAKKSKKPMPFKKKGAAKTDKMPAKGGKLAKKLEGMEM